ncbi:mechanosensitive ion channel [Acidimicrobium ferrooxidans]|uniref:Mechanosensitive ion channel n=1 Tax=Acidimicrobium ferrooxidans TaxID=53635 RepID=A0ABS3APC5_9ACTN|nr:mechanosensitive ion channel [Acidimicrobium ferrooxidans]
MPQIPGVPTTDDGGSITLDLGDLSISVAESLGRLAVAILGTLIAVRLVKIAIGRVEEHRLREQLLFFVPKAVGVVMTIAGLGAVGIDITGMAAVMATIGFTGAVVFTPVGQNLVAGAMIRIDHIYQVGEVVTIGDLHGVVLYRSMLRTELALPDGSTAWVPNSLFQENQVLNHSRMGGWRICVQVPLDCAADRAVALTVMNQTIEGLAWNSPDREPFVAFDHVGGEAMFFNVYAWIDDRTLEPWYRGLLLNALVDALEEVDVSVGQTTNLSINGRPQTKAIAPANRGASRLR